MDVLAVLDDRIDSLRRMTPSIGAEVDRATEARAAVAELVEALRQAHAQMAMAAECIEAKRYDEALLHVSAMCGHRERAIAKATGSQP